jgi:hypothetical protein
MEAVLSGRTAGVVLRMQQLVNCVLCGVVLLSALPI